MPIVGTPFSLNYRTSRAPGFVAARHVSIQIVGPTVPSVLSFVRVLVHIAGTVYFYGATGALLGSTTFSLPANGALVLNTATVPNVAGASGTITIAHDGGYGNLAVKSVALEPATGFSFDSPGLYKPY